MSSENLPAKPIDPRIADFVASMSSTGDILLSAAMAGLTEEHAAALLGQPVVRQQIEAQVFQRFETSILPKSIKAMADMLDSDTVPSAVKARIALGSLDIKRRSDEAGMDRARKRSIDELSREELEHRLNELRAQEARHIGSSPAD